MLTRGGYSYPQTVRPVEGLIAPPRLEDEVRRPSVLLALVQLLRPRQWVKNLACFAGLVFSGQLFVAGQILHAAIAFATFSAMASAIYILNDFLDRDKDRNNPRTAQRPLASGTLPLWLAGIAFIALLIAAGAGTFTLGWKSTLMLGGYAILNICYSLRLKQTVIADVMCIALGFVIRVLFGVYAVEVQPTAWIVLCMFFLALFMGFGKRKAELAAHGENSPAIRPVLHKYNLNFLDLMLGMSATMTIICYALFTVAAHKNPSLLVTIVPVVYCVTRYLLQVLVSPHGESPEVLLLKDRRMGAGILCWVGLCVVILYGNIQLFVE